MSYICIWYGVFNVCMKPINAIDNKYSKPSLNNANEGSKKLSIDPLAVDDIANYLVEVFGSPESREFYYKIAYYIPRPRIDQMVVQSKEKGKNPGALFNYLARKELG